MVHKERRNYRLVVICAAVVALGLIALTWYAPGWPLFVVELTALTLLCPGFNALGGSCSGNDAVHDTVLWGLLCAILGIALAVFLRRRARSGAGQSGRE